MVKKGGCGDASKGCVGASRAGRVLALLGAGGDLLECKVGREGGREGATSLECTEMGKISNLTTSSTSMTYGRELILVLRLSSDLRYEVR